MRRFLVPGLLALATGLALLAPVVRADATQQNLLERALEIMRGAERFHSEGDEARARAEALRALRLIQRADALVPEDPGTAFLGVQASVFTGDVEVGREWLGRLVRRSAHGERDPNLLYAHALVAHYLEARPDRAIAALERMQALAPRLRAVARDTLYYSALIAQGNRLVQAEDGEAAIRLFRTAALVARRTGRRHQEQAARANMGIALQRIDRYIEAGEIFDALRTESPENPLWHWYSGLCLANQSRFAESIPFYRRVIRFLEEGQVPAAHRSSLEDVHLRLGNCFRNLAGAEADPQERAALLERARRSLERYVTLHPGKAAGRYWLGTLFQEELELPYDALEQFRRAYEADPVCDGSLRSMIQIVQRNPPPPDVSAEQWRAWREAWQKELDAHAHERAEARRQREKVTADGTDGCS